MSGSDIGMIVLCVVLALWGAALLFSADWVWRIACKITGTYSDPSRGTLLFARICGFVLFVFGIGAVVMKVL
ncbi:hypothetical protein [Bifidobacterium vespertilionis]|uniref:Uncharacterized protein n=1 Tax=Bifidobacterium vespertilionis TaxID=2562524 RepID=A0A5J5DVL8_9BIFI|nr:hypothetical protein [Bifidobacterium vespertilionis]KAA8820773.1 hypothetical protein EMO90_06215 [Bifidobacterium vespertilionis]KAA8821062.1 hypothetical protein EM848_11480 [Bifidobacterium vespertilionis]MBT1179908.1 hypothetical protein [Bifidobacterium vespertilionis]